MLVSTINTPMTSATARYADSLRLSVAPMMDWTYSLVGQGFCGFRHINGALKSPGGPADS
ncbi:hypothetical protein D7Y49_15375 [Stenotrophomonas maltophilia]|nr:hypothetical protein [Stenotrophomonas maltophilia]